MRAVYKYPIEVGVTELKFNGAAPPRFLAVQVQHGVPCTWWLVDPSPEDEEVRVVRLIVVGTGHEWEHLDQWTYLGTFQLEGGAFVGHLFQQWQAQDA